MKTEEIQEIEEAIGYTFQNKMLLEQAFTRSSYVNEFSKKAKTQSNEVLEFFGDSVLSCVLSYLLLNRHGSVTNQGFKSTLTEEDFSIAKSNLSDKSALGAAMKKLKINRFLKMSNGDRNQNVLKEDSPNEDLFESIVGAIALDSHMNLNILVDVVLRLDDTKWLLEKKITKNPKNQIKEYCEKNKISYSFEVLEKTGPDNEPTHKVKLTIQGINQDFIGVARKKMTAEKEASKLAIEYLKID